MDQVHGSNIRVLDSKGTRLLENNIVPQTDGLITNQENVFLMIKTADCFPVLFFDPKNKAVGAVHVGWRGAIEKIFLNTLLKMIDQFGSNPKDIVVGIGPGIKACCFKHKNLIQEKQPEWKEYIDSFMDKFRLNQYCRLWVMPIAKGWRDKTYNRNASDLKEHNVQMAIDYCKEHSMFSLCMQLHKVLRIP